MWYATLHIDAMYFDSARMCYQAAETSQNGIDKSREAHAALIQEQMAILERYGGDSTKAYDELEPIYIRLEGTEYGIRAAYGPYLQNIALTHILCTAALEAHINVIGREKLKGKHWDHFEKMSLEAKWLFLPVLLRKAAFEVGAEPFQSFSTMVKYRNELVHHKSKKEPWDRPSDSEPQFLKKLGLSLQKARKSLETSKQMMLNLADKIDRERPYWLRPGYDGLPRDIVTNFFEVKPQS